MIAYPIGDSGQTLVFTDTVLEHFRAYLQRKLWNREAGGQLFARIFGDQFVIEDVTGPRKTDQRKRSSYYPDTAAEQREIDERFPKGLHFVGDWHTHPEAVPKPSKWDLDAISKSFRQSHHVLQAFVLVIVGTADQPDGLFVSLHDGVDIHQLKPFGREVPEL